MLVHLGNARTERADRQLACCLAGVAGGLNAVAFYAVGFFAANMTGNVSALSNHISLAQWQAAGFCGAIVLLFMAGAAATTVFISAGLRRDDKGIYAKAVLIEALLLALLGLAALSLSGIWQTPCVVLGLAFIMGLQNAMVTRISGARVRTTHISGMVTDIGIEAALLFDARRGMPPPEGQTEIRSRLYLHLQTVGSFFIGGIIGILIYRQLGFWTLEVAAALIALIGLSALKNLYKSDS